MNALRTSILCALSFLSLHVFSQTPKSVSEFRSMEDGDTTSCILHGVVSHVRNYEHGNLYLKDETGEVLIFGIRGQEPEQGFKSLDIRKGDTLTLSGRRTIYERTTVEMKNAVCLKHTPGPDHNLMPDGTPLDVEPLFKGEKPSKLFPQWVSSHLHYPEQARKDYAEGTVVISFNVDKKGKVTNVRVVQSIHPALDAEAVRVVSKSPRWTPGMNKRKPVNANFTLPVAFSLNM